MSPQRKTTPAVYLCGDGPGSYGYEGHECQRKGCGHYRNEHTRGDSGVRGAITGQCSYSRCKCTAFEELP